MRHLSIADALSGIIRLALGWLWDQPCKSLNRPLGRNGISSQYTSNEFLQQQLVKYDISDPSEMNMDILQVPL